MPKGHYAEVPEIAFARAVIGLHKARKISKVIDSAAYRLSEAEFVSCGGRVGKRKRDDYSLYRQLTYAERSFRKIIKMQMSLFDEESKTPGKKQITKVLKGCRDLLNDTNTSTAAWDHSDDEDVDYFDGSNEEEDDEEDEKDEEDEAEKADDDEDDADAEDDAEDDADNDDDADEEDEDDYAEDDADASEASNAEESDGEEGSDDDEKEE